MSEIHKLCEKWIDNPSRNPYDGKILETYDEEYHNYVELCSQLGYKKDIGEMFARERLYSERERERARIGEKKLPPRITNSPEKHVRQYLKPSVNPPTIPVLRPAILPPTRRTNSPEPARQYLTPSVNPLKISVPQRTPSYYEEDEETEEEEAPKKDYGYYFGSEEDFVDEDDYYL